MIVFVATMASCTIKKTTTTTTVPTYARAIELSSIKVTVDTPKVMAGYTLQVKAIGTYSDGSTADITSMVIWTSSNKNIAAISSAGLVTGIAAGTNDITAALAKVSSAAVKLTVTN